MWITKYLFVILNIKSVNTSQAGFKYYFVKHRVTDLSSNIKDVKTPIVAMTTLNEEKEG